MHETLANTPSPFHLFLHTQGGYGGYGYGGYGGRGYYGGGRYYGW